MSKAEFFSLLMDRALLVKEVRGSAFYRKKAARQLLGASLESCLQETSRAELKEAVSDLEKHSGKGSLPLAIQLTPALGSAVLRGEITRLGDGGLHFFGHSGRDGETEREHRLRRVLSHAVDGIIVERKNKALFANEAMAELLGLASVDALITGKSIAEYIHEKDKKRVSEITRTRLAGGPAPEKYNMRVIRQDNGETLWVTVHAGPIEWKGKKATISVLRDVTAEVKATQARERTEKLLKNIYDTIPDAVSLSRMTDNKFIEVNPGFERIFGYKKEEVMGKSADDLGMWADEESRRAVQRELRSDKFLRYAEGQIITKEGKMLHIAFTASTLREEGNECMIVVARDITEKKEQERELRKSKEIAEQASNAKSDFLAKVSHELRTPLNAIMGFSETMSSEMFGPLGDPHYRDYIGDIYDSGKHLLNLINDILDLSKMEAGKLEIRPEILDVRQVISDCVRIMRGRAESVGIVLKTAVPDHEVNLKLDEVRLRQILLNLLSNSIKFTPEGGHIRIGLRKLKAGWKLFVQDTGPGMTERELEKALSPFDQVLSADISHPEGTGLGLPLTKALVELMDGTFKIQSKKGKGTTVSAIFEEEQD